jgi:membrane protease YdiL (CAAX protease family)
VTATRRWTLLAEAVAVFALILGYIWYFHEIWRWAWLIPLAFMIVSNVLNRESPRRLGLDTSELPIAMRRLGPLVLIVALAWVIAGLALQTIRRVPIEFAIGGFVLYCGWGLMQQYALNGFLLNRLCPGLGRRWAPVLAAIAFAAVHTPNVFLMAVTLIGGYLAALAYLRYRNLIVLGLAHGLLGFVIYMVVPDSVSLHLYVGPACFAYMRVHGFTAWLL